MKIFLENNVLSARLYHVSSEESIEDMDEYPPRDEWIEVSYFEYGATHISIYADITSEWITTFDINNIPDRFPYNPFNIKSKEETGSPQGGKTLYLDDDFSGSVEEMNKALKAGTAELFKCVKEIDNYDIVLDRDQIKASVELSGKIDVNAFLEEMEGKFLVIESRDYGYSDGYDLGKIEELSDIDSLRPDFVCLDLIEDLINDSGDEIVVPTDITNEFDYSEDSCHYYRVEDGKIIDFEL